MVQDGDWPPVKLWLFRYVLMVAVLAFCNRSLPTAFLPLVLRSEFKEPFAVIGFAMAMYAAAALVASPWATRVSLRAKSVVNVHSYALLFMAFATCLFATCDKLVPIIGRTPAMACVIVFRFLQGTSSALYLASNTTLVTRMFHANVPYVLGMVEVAVGVGSQLGRMAGGFFFDLGGFAFPFVFLAVLQAAWCFVGLAFFSDTDKGGGALQSRQAVMKPVAEQALPWSAFVTKRGVVALLGVWGSFLCIGFLDTTLPSHLEENVGPIPIMHRNIVSYECLMIIGAVNTVVGLLFMGPISPIQSLFATFFGGDLPLEIRWAVQIFAIMFIPAGLATLFIPSLPLLQSEVRHLGGTATEQVAQLFIAAMSLGEATGPILGGLAVARYGFNASSALLSLPAFLVLVGALLTYDRDVVEARAKMAEGALLEHEDHGSNMQPSASGFWPGDFVDGDSAFRWRRLPYALQQETAPPDSAPALAWRRTYTPVASRRPWSSVPSDSYRRGYRPATNRG